MYSIQKKLGLKKLRFKHMLVKENVVNKIKVQQNFGSRKLLGSKKFWVQKIFGTKISGNKIYLQKIKIKLYFLNSPLKFGQNWVSNSWDIPDMDKCRQD